jgi:pantoate--beta-alanine ligase
MDGFPIADTIAELRASLAAARKAGARIALAPTMGALHEGHLSLAREAKKRADFVVISIFVNPTQFAAGEDFDSYPRTLDEDAEKLAAAGSADLIFAPPVREMYPKEFATGLIVGGPAKGLESDFRPHFFSGVAVIVAKLLIAALPDVALFGEKDYQQLLVVRRMAADLALPIEIVGVPIVREAGGLALSSRNVYLSAAERKVAVQLNYVLATVRDAVREGGNIAAAEETGKKALLAAGFGSVDYVAVRDAATLQPLEKLDRPARVLAAAKIGRTRLIDNLAV